MLRPCDVTFKPRSVKVSWALDVDGSIKPTKNEQRRITIFPRSLTAEMEEAVGAAAFDASAIIRQHEERQCGCGLFFPAAKGGPMVYATFHQWWIKAADAVGWPMIKPLTRSRSYGKDLRKGKGWRLGLAGPSGARTTCATSPPAGCCSISSSTTRWWPKKMGHHNANYTRKTYAGTRGDVDQTVSDLTEDW